MQRRYRRRQAALFDLTRWSVLFGRRQLTELLRPAARVIEVGCGTGHNLDHLRARAGPDSEVVGIECAPAMVRRARARAIPGVTVRELEYGPHPAGPCDAMVFAYSLSMIPDFDQVLDTALDDLRPGGQLLVLDFVDTPSRLVAWALRVGGVALGPARWDALRARFIVDDEIDSGAYFGLWRWRLLDARYPG